MERIAFSVDEAAHSAGYVHPSLASVRHGGDEHNPLRITEVRRIIVSPGNSDENQRIK
jgi:hypothetical protein